MAQRIAFLPFPEIREHEKVAVVDSTHPTAFITLSHWRGAPQLPGLHDDTSTGIVLNALKAKLPELEEVRWATNNHWDIDGFLGVWAMLNPEHALQHETLLRRMAAIGDFREYEPVHPEEDLALKLVCWLNTVERNQFYPPFAAPDSEAKEAVASAPKYVYFLELFADVLEHPTRYMADWQEEYALVKEHFALLEGSGRIQDFPEIRLRIIWAPKPVHYYALFANTGEVDVVATIYPDQVYEIEQKYTTWVDVANRVSYPRADFRRLAERLSKLEADDRQWIADAPFDTGPLLRVDTGKMSKAERFDHPTTRPYRSSGISEDAFLAELTSFFNRYYQDLSPKVNWSWEETKRLLAYHQ